MKLDDLLLNLWGYIFQPLIVLLFGVAMLVFLWGIVQFVQNAESEAGRKDGVMHIIGGIIGMVIMVSAFGILRFVANTVGNGAPEAIDKTPFK